jgi:hypothetical protein
MTLEQAKRKETEAVVTYTRHKAGEGVDYSGYVGSSVQMSRLDGLLYFREGLAFGIEIKWRRFDLHTLMTQHNGEMLMPADKLLAGQAFAYAFGVPTLLLYLLEDCLLVQKVVAGNGDKVNVLREIYELSDRTAEGGTIQRKNCYIQAEGAERIPL